MEDNLLAPLMTTSVVQFLLHGRVTMADAADRATTKTVRDLASSRLFHV